MKRQEENSSPRPAREVCLGHVNHHDRRVTFYQKNNDGLSLETYQPGDAPLRAENGLGALVDAPLSIRLFEVLKAGESGIKDLSPVGGQQLPMRRVLSSVPYDCQISDVGDVSVKFLQFQKPDAFLEKPGALRDYYGRRHEGITGKEIKALVTVKWIHDIGLVIEPVHIGENTFEEEAAYAESVVQDPEKMGLLTEFFASVQPSVEELLAQNNDESVPALPQKLYQKQKRAS